MTPLNPKSDRLVCLCQIGTNTSWLVGKPISSPSGYKISLITFLSRHLLLLSNIATGARYIYTTNIITPNN